MSKVVLVANRVDDLVVEGECDYIGVDGGSLYCLNHNIQMVCAIGDFDSISEEDLIRLNTHTKTIKLPVEKDVVDSEYALNYASELGYDEIEITGVMGGRQDHFLAIYQLLKTGSVPFVIKDEYNIIYRLDAGEYELKKEMQYLSFFACEQLKISVTGVKYPLYDREIQESDVYLVSNEIVEEKAKLKVSGRIIVIQSNSLE